MKYIYNNKLLRERRRELRNNATEPEQILWQYLKNSKVGGHKFVRQYSIGPYILDFYCPKLRLCVELDGNVHTSNKSQLYDKDREKYLESVNIKVIRFWNGDIINNIDEVLHTLRKNIEGRNTPS